MIKRKYSQLNGLNQLKNWEVSYKLMKTTLNEYLYYLIMTLYKYKNSQQFN